MMISSYLSPSRSQSINLEHLFLLLSGEEKKKKRRRRKSIFEKTTIKKSNHNTRERKKMALKAMLSLVSFRIASVFYTVEKRNCLLLLLY